jgi:hypothetical protein
MPNAGQRITGCMCETLSVIPVNTAHDLVNATHSSVVTNHRQPTCAMKGLVLSLFHCLR